MRGAEPPWWRGARGEWLVAAQLVLIAVVFLGPGTLPGLPRWPTFLARISIFAGAALMLAGGCLLLAGLLGLGTNLTALPYPKAHATLVTTGPYRLVRHPMYAGGIVLESPAAIVFILVPWIVGGGLALLSLATALGAALTHADDEH